MMRQSINLESPCDTIKVRVKSWKESAKLSSELSKRFEGMLMVLNNNGVFIIDDRTGRSCGPYRHLGTISSKEIASFFSIEKPGHILAWILCLSSGVERLRFDEAIRIIEDYRQRHLSKASQEVWGNLQ